MSIIFTKIVLPCYTCYSIFIRMLCFVLLLKYHWFIVKKKNLLQKYFKVNAKHLKESNINKWSSWQLDDKKGIDDVF